MILSVLLIYVLPFDLVEIFKVFSKKATHTCPVQQKITWAKAYQKLFSDYLSVQISNID